MLNTEQHFIMVMIFEVYKIAKVSHFMLDLQDYKVYKIAKVSHGYITEFQFN